MNTLRRLLTGSHEHTESRMSEHLDEELRWFARFRFVQHLAWCDGCSSMYECLRVTVGGLRSMKSQQPEPAPAIADAVVEQIHREQLESGGQ